MGGSFLICRIAGVPWRAHWSLILLPILLLYQPLINIRTNPDNFLPSVIWMLALLLAVICHEAAHAVAGRRLGGTVHGVTLLPFGGITQVSGIRATTGAHVALSLAGPFCNLALAAIAYVIAAASHGTLSMYVGFFSFWSVLLGLFNLVPAPMLDGGQALRAVLHAKLGHGRGDVWSGRIGIAAAVVIGVAGLMSNSILMMILAAIAAATSIQLLRQGASAEPFGSPRVPPSGDFRTWRLPKKELAAEIERKRAAERANKEVREKVDLLLKQISEKGIESLSEKDRSFLKAASRRLREQGR